MTAREVLQKHWGYNDFRPLQHDIIESVLAGRDTLGLMPTGGGKSVTFQVPALMLPHLTLVVTPLVSLMKDQVDNLKAHRVAAAYIHSGLTAGEKNYAMDRARLGKVKMLYVSPEKLQSASFLDELRFMKLSLLVVDEAHCISQWGHDFRPSYMKIPTVRDIFPDIPVLALTATATPAVRRDITESLKMRTPAMFTQSFRRDNISLIVRLTENKTDLLLKSVAAIQGTMIVYVRSRKRARELALLLQENGHSASYYHAGLEPEEKTLRQNSWKTGECRIMVATNAFGMGIDKADVRGVVHYDLPNALEEYYQEIGRAGRDGQHSWAITIASVPDKGVLTRRFHEAFPPREFIRGIYSKACAFMGVAVGDGYNRTYDFNFSLFCRRHDLQAAPTRSALEILSQAGWMEFSDDLHASARIMMSVRKEELYNFSTDPLTEQVLEKVLRLYSGVFADYVAINEAVVARSLAITDTEVYEALLKLNRLQILHYVPRRMTPYIYFPTSREEERYITLPVNVYEERREQMRRRIEAMTAFVFGRDRCRSGVILEYFGEPACNCGRCDVCRDAGRDVASEAASEISIENSLRYLSKRGVTLSYIMAQFDAGKHNRVTAKLRELIDSGVLRLNADGTIGFVGR